MTTDISFVHDHQLISPTTIEGESQELNAGNAQLAQEQAKQLEVLMDLARGITTRLDPDVLYRTILADVQRLVPCERAVLYLYTEGVQELYPVAEFRTGISADHEHSRISDVKTTDLQEEKIRLDSPLVATSVIAWAALHRHLMVRTPSAKTQEARDKTGDAAQGNDRHESETDEDLAVMAIPLVSKHVLYGVMVLRRHEPFASKELRLMRNLSTTVAVAMENSVLFQKVREVTRMKANFISMITHELRSPINAINGYLDLALTGMAGELNEQLHEFLLRARSGSEHLYALIEDLLLVSRADADQLRLNREVIDLHEVVANAIEEMELTAQDCGIDLTIDIAKNFPQLYADSVRIQHVLRNLVSNALRFTSAGGQVRVEAHIEERSQEHPENEEEADKLIKRVVLRVSDTGCGIAPKYQQHIFERFYQVPQNTVRVVGQGLGLTVVKMIVELHGGQVTVESELGEGSVFTCILPCVLS